MEILDKQQLIGTCKKLPFEFDTQAILEEIQSIPDTLWGQQRVKVHQDTQAVFLRGYPARERRPDEDRPILTTLPKIKEIAYQRFPGTPGKCLVANLKANGIIHLHTDRYSQNNNTIPASIRQYFLSTLRIHIPIQTHPEVMFYCNGDFFHLSAGHAWLINNHDLHAVINAHPHQSRIHLIVDIHPSDDFIKMVQDITPLSGEQHPDLFNRIDAASN